MLEAADKPGGGSRTDETIPGHRFNTHAAAHNIINMTRIPAELDLAGARDIVVGAHREFLPLNRRLGAACTDWQMRPAPGDPMAFNDHTDWRWDERVLQTLTWLEGPFGRLGDQLSGCLERFG